MDDKFASSMQKALVLCVCVGGGGACLVYLFYGAVDPIKGNVLGLGSRAGGGLLRALLLG